MIGGVILSGGASQRMGKPKALLPFPAQPLVAAQWLALRCSSVDPLRIVVGEHSGAIIEGSNLALENFVVNERHADGQFSSIQAGLRSLLQDDTWPAALIQPVDAWPASPDLVARLVAELATSGAVAVLPAHRGKGGHPVLLARPLCERLVELDGRTTRLDDVLHQLEAAGACHRIEAGNAAILENVNAPEDYQRLLRRLGGSAAPKRKAPKKAKRPAPRRAKRKPARRTAKRR